MSRIGTLYAGDTRRIRLTVQDPDDVSELYDFATKAEAVEMVLGICGEPTALTVVWQVDAGIVLALGQVLLTLLPADTENLEEGTYELRIRVVELDGDRFTVYSETVTVPCAFPSTVVA